MHGMIILGNAEDLSSDSAKSPMWQRVISDLKARGQIGEGIPIACHNHKQTTVIISEPGELPIHAPDGTVELVASNIKLIHL